MKPIPRISEAEWEVLGVLWKRAPLTATQVFEALSAGKTWKLNTVRTFLARLEKKGAVSAQDRPEAREFSPTVSREACVREESESFLARVFEGGAAALLLHFSKSKPLNSKELLELEAILIAKRKKGKR